MADQYSRTRLLLGDDGLNRLRRARIALFGLGGVGGYVAEALARSGIGNMDLIDDDSIHLTNLNRQIFALHSTVGMTKVEAAKLQRTIIRHKADEAFFVIQGIQTIMKQFIHCDSEIPGDYRQQCHVRGRKIVFPFADRLRRNRQNLCQLRLGHTFVSSQCLDRCSKQFHMRHTFLPLS